MHKKDPQIVDLQIFGLSDAFAHSATAAKGWILAIPGMLRSKSMLL